MRDTDRKQKQQSGDLNLKQLIRTEKINTLEGQLDEEKGNLTSYMEYMDGLATDVSFSGEQFLGNVEDIPEFVESLVNEIWTTEDLKGRLILMVKAAGVLDELKYGYVQNMEGHESTVEIFEAKQSTDRGVISGLRGELESAVEEKNNLQRRLGEEGGKVKAVSKERDGLEKGTHYGKQQRHSPYQPAGQCK